MKVFLQAQTKALSLTAILRSRCLKIEGDEVFWGSMLRNGFRLRKGPSRPGRSAEACCLRCVIRLTMRPVALRPRAACISAPFGA